ncbi:MAG: hypothetical protein UX49_C0021G0026, partial [Candidatus Wolfebacteria bacterium GW2011_GWC2_46_275]
QNQPQRIFFEIVTEQDVTLDFEVIFLPGRESPPSSLSQAQVPLNRASALLSSLCSVTPTGKLQFPRPPKRFLICTRKTKSKNTIHADRIFAFCSNIRTRFELLTGLGRFRIQELRCDKSMGY